MRSYVFLSAILFALASLALPLAAHAAAIPFFGPIVPPENAVCPASWGALINVINNIIRFLITITIVFVAPLMVAYSGFLFVVNPVNASGKEQAKKILWNTVIGIVIALSGWLIVDAIMAVLYKPSATLPTWSSLITSGGIESCLDLRVSPKNDQTAVTTPGITTTPGTGGAKGGYYQRNPALLTRDQTGTNWTEAEKNQLYTGTQAIGILQSAKIEINRGYSPVGQDCGTQCTSLNGIPKTTITTLVTAKSACTTCSIVITGGTEMGHSSQGFGRASIDLRYDENTYNHLSKEGVRVVREARTGSPQCGTAGWSCYSHVTAPHMSVYTSGGTVTQ